MKKGIDYPGVSIIFLCHDGKGNILLNKRSANCRDEHGKWDCGGGGLEFGHKAIDTLKKEILEEYCTDIIGFEFLGFRDVHRNHEGVDTHWIALDFKIHVDREKVMNGEPHKFEELKWFTMDQLPSGMHSQLPAFFEKYKEKI